MPIQKITSGIIQDGAIVAADIVSIANTQITGNIVSSQITSVANTQITGNIVSSQITSVANTQITGNITATTATNLAGGSNGTIPYQSASGTTQMLAVGTSGQLLQTNGAGAPSWVTASAGALTLLSTVTASSVASADVETTFNSTYDNYVIVGTVSCATDSAALTSLFKISGSYVTSGYYWHASLLGAADALYNANASTNTSSFRVGGNNGSASGSSFGFVMYIYNASSTSLTKKASVTGASNRGTTYQSIITGGGNTGTGALTGIRFQADAGNITGTFRLYGIANS